MPTKFMKLGFDEQVLRTCVNTDMGYDITVGLNYYRGTPLSAVEHLALTVDGQSVPQDAILIEIHGKLLRIDQVPLAFTEYWGVREPIILHVFSQPLSPGRHRIDLVLHARVVYMEFAPGIFGQFDGSSSATFVIQEDGSSEREAVHLLGDGSPVGEDSTSNTDRTN